MIVMYAGIASEKSSKGMSLIELAIIRPTMIRTGAVAALGIARNSGEKNRAMAKNIAMVNAVSPLLPPWATPDELSMNVQAADVPNKPEEIVPIESAINIRLIPGMLPLLSVNPPFMQTPIAEPVRLNRSMNRNDITVTSISVERILSNSN